MIDIHSGARRDGTITAWECHNYNSGPAAIRPPYQIANQLIQFHAVDAPPLRQGRIAGWRQPPTTLPASLIWTNWRTR